MSEPKTIYLSPPDTGEREQDYVREAMASGWVAPVGPHLKQFEESISRYMGGGYHCLAVNSGTAALHLGLLLLQVGPGDRVYVPTFTFAASANAVRYCGAIPVLIDSSEDSWNLCPDTLQKLLKRDAANGLLPKAIITVDLYGNCCDYEEIRKHAAYYDVPILQDAAEALGAEFQGEPAGRQGDLAVFSFNGNKILTTSGGGVLLSKDREKIERARYWATQAREPVLHYEHQALGYNYRLSNILAALGCAQMTSLTEKVKARRKQYQFYKEIFNGVPGVELNPIDNYGLANCWLSCVRVRPDQSGLSVDKLRQIMAGDHIEARPVWKPLHLQPYHGQFPYHGARIAETIFEEGLCLPSGSNLTDDDRSRIATAISTWLGTG